MTEVIQYGQLDYVTDGKRIGDYFRLNYEPEMSGHFVGYNAKQDCWLLHLTVPYGAKSKVYSVLPEAFLQVVEAKESDKS